MLSLERSPNTMRTSSGICDRRSIIDAPNGRPADGSAENDDIEPVGEPLELHETVVVELTDGRRLDFEVVGLLEDDTDRGYAVCYCKEEDEFVVTDAFGEILEDDDLAQEILEDFLSDVEPADGDAAAEETS